jgi:hypothetical protein
MKLQAAHHRPLLQQRQRPPSRAARQLQQRLQGKRCGGKALAHEGREPAIQARGTEVQGCKWSWRSRRQRNLLRLLPPQHRRWRPPVRQHRTSGRRLPQSAPAGHHSHPRHENENGTVPEHEYRPRGVRRVVRPPPGAAGHRRPDRGRNVAPWLGSSSPPSPAWLEDASSAELEDGFHPQKMEEEAGRQPTPRQPPTRCAPPPQQGSRKSLKLRAGRRPQPGLLLPTIELVVTVLGGHR